MVISTPSPSANSYASNAEAVAIWAADPYKAGDAPATEARQDLVLIASTNAINDHYQTRFRGAITNAENALYWPRNNVPNPRTGQNFATDDYPDILKRATALYAYYIDKSNRNVETPTIEQGPVIEQSLEGVGTIRFAQPTTIPLQRLPVIPSEVNRILAPLVTGTSGSGFSTSIMERG